MRALHHSDLSRGISMPWKIGNFYMQVLVEDSRCKRMRNDCRAI